MGIIYSRAVMELFTFTAYLIAMAKVRHHPLPGSGESTGEKTILVQDFTGK
jgi:hypothetical protein